MYNKTIALAAFILGTLTVSADSIPTGFALPPQWRIGIESTPATVPGTNSFLKGQNAGETRINTSLSGDIRADFTYNPGTRTGMLYRDVYQGIGLGIRTFFADKELGTPVSAYVYQGAPIVRFGRRLHLGYEWQFGAAFGWKHYDTDNAADNAAIGTSVTAHMGLSLKVHYALASRWMLSIGATANHFSNGNTAYPNGGVNTIGVTAGIAYTLNPQTEYRPAPAELTEEADRGKWFCDITAFGATRVRIVNVGDPAEPQLCPGHFGVAGLQVAPMRRLNRMFAVGAALDAQWDESAGIEPYWVEGSSDNDIKFYRPPFGKQINIGLSAHAELIMPIFSVNIGVGYDFISPAGDKAFYQMLTLKTFVTDRLYLNTGYRLSAFKNPQNLMLGIGLRI